jgi:hypothetical protein
VKACESSRGGAAGAAHTKRPMITKLRALSFFGPSLNKASPGNTGQGTDNPGTGAGDEGQKLALNQSLNFPESKGERNGLVDQLGGPKTQKISPRRERRSDARKPTFPPSPSLQLFDAPNRPVSSGEEPVGVWIRGIV